MLMKYKNLFFYVLIVVAGMHWVVCVALQPRSDNLWSRVSDSPGQALLLSYHRNPYALKQNIQQALGVSDSASQDRAFNTALAMDTAYYAYADDSQQSKYYLANCERSVKKMVSFCIMPFVIWGTYYGWQYYSITRKISDRKKRAKERRDKLNLQTDEYPKDVQDIEKNGQDDKNILKQSVKNNCEATLHKTMLPALGFSCLTLYYMANYFNFRARRFNRESHFETLHNEFSALVGPRR